MALTFPIVFSLAPLPTLSGLDANAFAQAIVANLQATIGGSFLTGQIGGTKPTQNIGPWYDGTFWEAFNTASNQYLPIPVTPVYCPVINGTPQIWQRATGFISTGNGTPVADKYKVFTNMATGTASVTQGTAIGGVSPLFQRSPYPLKITVTTPEASPGAGEYYVIIQGIEKSLARPLFDSPTALSIVLRSSVVGTYCVTLRNNDNSQSYVMECPVTVPNTPQYFQFNNIPAFPTTLGNWGTSDTDLSYQIIISASTGGNFQTAPNTWTSANRYASPNQSNLFSTNGNTLEFAFLQHEYGPTATPFRPVPFDVDLMRCQRYYFKSYPYALLPGTAQAAQSIVSLTLNTSIALATFRYPVKMRISPTHTIYNYINGATGSVYDTNSGVNIGATPGLSQNSEDGFSVVNFGIGGTAGHFIQFHLTADADF